MPKQLSRQHASWKNTGYLWRRCFGISFHLAKLLVCRGVFLRPFSLDTRTVLTFTLSSSYFLVCDRWGVSRGVRIATARLRTGLHRRARRSSATSCHENRDTSSKSPCCIRRWRRCGDFRNDISVHVFAKRRSPTWGSVFSLEHPLSFH